ncbi:hypothetical protein [Brevibacillus sp. BC25]|uniref:hypothetical protein n=1 Tax=Brevibacillus sp. BC25 TaxID=1144308 RepID=UPI00027137B1|nr:hypothetical protein [Brevibacillus sp. BC25]EJL30004.1 hypothetical protein PMI05_01620 [Brevibacillus sp. BC25]
MTSTELLNLFDKLGLPTYITSAVVIVLFMIYKFDVLTLFSASSIELRLLTKEQRITNKIFTFILTNMMLALLTSVLVMVYIEYDLLLGDMNQVLFSVLFFVSTMHTSLAYIITETSSLNSLRNNKTFRIVSIVLVFCTFPYLSLIITPITAEAVQQQNGMSFKIFTTMFLTANIFTPLYFFYFIIINKMMVPKKAYYIEMNASSSPLSIIYPNSSPSVQIEKWYLIHPINKDQLLLAEDSNLVLAKKVKLIARTELTQYVVKIE